jgi:hypothetical protein
MFVLFFIIVSGLDMLEQEVQETSNLIRALNEKVEYLISLKEELGTKGISIPEDDDWRKIPGLVPQPSHDYLPLRLKQLSTNSGNIKSVDFLALKSKDPSPHIAYIVCESSLVSVFEMKGKLIGTYAVPNILLCAGSSTPEESMIGVVSPYEITILSLENNIIQFISSRSLFNDTAMPTSFINYSRLGKKYWLVGDDYGRITFYSAIGEIIGQGNTGTKKVAVLDKYGSQVVFAGENKVGVFNLADMNVYQLCEPSLGNIIDISQDIGATIVYAATDTGRIFIYDTKYSSSSSGPICKSIAVMPSQHKIHKIAMIRSSLLVLSDGVIASYNVSGVDQEVFYPPVYYKLNTASIKNNMKSLRLANSGNYLVLYGNYDLISFEVSLYGIQNSIKEWIDFDTLRVLVILISIGGVILWRYLTKKTPASKSIQDKKYSDIKKKPKNSQKKVKFAESPQEYNYSD